MTSNTIIDESIEEIKKGGEQLARKATYHPLTEKLTRLGLAVRGLLYSVMGVLAIQVVSGSRSAPADQQGAIAAIGAQPAGRLLLAVIAIGLVGYALWGLARALFDPLQKGSDLKGILLRMGYLLSAISYGGLVIPTYLFVLGGARAVHNGDQGAQTRQAAATLLSLPGGRWAIGAIAIGVLLGGLYFVYAALRGDFERQFQPYDLSREQARWIDRIGRFGSAARGVVFALVGFFLFLAAYRANPQAARGVDEALLVLARQPYGPWLLGVVAVGLLSFGLYSALGSIWFRMKK